MGEQQHSRIGQHRRYNRPAYQQHNTLTQQLDKQQHRGIQHQKHKRIIQQPTKRSNLTTTTTHDKIKETGTTGRAGKKKWLWWVIYDTKGWANIMTPCWVRNNISGWFNKYTSVGYNNRNIISHVNVNNNYISNKKAFGTLIFFINDRLWYLLVKVKKKKKRLLNIWGLP